MPGRPPRAASLLVRAHYWRFKDGDVDGGDKPAGRKRRVRSRAVDTDAVASDSSGAQLHKDRSHSESSGDNSMHVHVPKKRRISAPTADSAPVRSAKFKPGKAAKPQPRRRPPAAPVEPPPPPPETLAAGDLIESLRVAYDAPASTTSVLPGKWRFDVRLRGTSSRRTLVCPCGARLRSMHAVAQHVAPADGSARGPACAVPVDDVHDAHTVAMKPTKLSVWQHRHDGGLIPSD